MLKNCSKNNLPRLPCIRSIDRCIRSTTLLLQLCCYFRILFLKNASCGLLRLLNIWCAPLFIVVVCQKEGNPWQTDRQTWERWKRLKKSKRRVCPVLKICKCYGNKRWNNERLRKLFWTHFVILVILQHSLRLFILNTFLLLPNTFWDCLPNTPNFFYYCFTYGIDYTQWSILTTKCFLRSFFIIIVLLYFVNGISTSWDYGLLSKHKFAGNLVQYCWICLFCLFCLNCLCHA